MNRTLLSLSVAAMALGASVARAEVTDDQIKALEARIAQLEAEKPAAPAAPADATLGKLKINGFMSAGFGRADIDGFNYDNGLDSQWSHNADSLVGLRIDAKVNDRVDAVTQLVARGDQDFAVNADWAYIGYRPTDSDEIRAGRLRAPFYLLSEYLDVGYAYPWASPPAEVYKSSLPYSFDGLYYGHKLNAGNWHHEFQLTWGSTKSPASSTTQVDATNAYGGSYFASTGNWLFGVRASRAELDATGGIFSAFSQAGVTPPIERDLLRYGAVGAQYDDGKLLFMVEGTQIKIKGFLSDSQQSYATLGYRFGKVMPHITYATTRTTDNDQRGDVAGLPALCPAADPNPNASLCLAIVPNTMSLPPPTTIGIPFPADSLARLLNTAQDSLTLGVRYDFLPNADLKLDWTHVLDTHATFGLFTPKDGNVFYDATPGNDINVYRVAVDVTF